MIPLEQLERVRRFITMRGEGPLIVTSEMVKAVCCYIAALEADAIELRRNAAGMGGRDAEDAARWRYLRNRHDDGDDTLCVMMDGVMVEDFYVHDPEALDLTAAVDAAMEQAALAATHQEGGR